MTFQIVVTYMTPSASGPIDAVGSARITESFDANGTTVARAKSGEVALVSNVGDEPARMARGTTPNAAANVATTSTGSGVAVPAGMILPVRMRANDRISVHRGV